MRYLHPKSFCLISLAMFMFCVPANATTKSLNLKECLYTVDIPPNIVSLDKGDSHYVWKGGSDVVVAIVARSGSVRRKYYEAYNAFMNNSEGHIWNGRIVKDRAAYFISDVSDGGSLGFAFIANCREKSMIVIGFQSNNPGRDIVIAMVRRLITDISGIEGVMP